MKHKEQVIEIIGAKYLKDYQIKLSFSDGKTKKIDFEKFLNGSLNPATRKFLSLSEFRKFRVNYGDLIWGDYEMCFPIWDLYEGKV